MTSAANLCLCSLTTNALYQVTKARYECLLLIVEVVNAAIDLYVHKIVPLVYNVFAHGRIPVVLDKVMNVSCNQSPSFTAGKACRECQL
jgi:hypothetical protein